MSRDVERIGDQPTAAPTPAQPRWRRAVRHPLFHLAAALVIVALAQLFVAKVYQVPSASMEQTLIQGDRILVDRISPLVRDPAPGDVIVFDRPESWREPSASQPPAWRVMVGWFGDVFGFGPSNGDALVKRIVAGPGQTVACCSADGRLAIDGVPLNEPYVSSDFPFTAGESDCSTTPRSLRCFDEIALGDDEYLVLGDNRADSLDSVSPCRGEAAVVANLVDGCVRTVPHSDIVGPVLVRFWPLDRWGAP